MKEFVFITALVALTAAFGLLLFYKLGIIERLQVKGSRLIAGWASCLFCQAFWACVFVTVFVLVYDFQAVYFAVPVLATPVTRLLTK